MIRGVKIVSIPVSNQDVALQFYTEKIGFKVATDQPFGPGRRWIELLRSLGRRVTPSAANFIFFETGMPHAEFAARLSDQGVEIGREFAPYERWARVSIGLPEENSIARDAVRRLLGATGA